MRGMGGSPFPAGVSEEERQLVEAADGYGNHSRCVEFGIGNPCGFSFFSQHSWKLTARRVVGRLFLWASPLGSGPGFRSRVAKMISNDVYRSREAPPACCALGSSKSATKCDF